MSLHMQDLLEKGCSHQPSVEIVFASALADSILAGIRAVTGPASCRLIVKNDTGDCLNFGLAVESAKI